MKVERERKKIDEITNEIDPESAVHDTQNLERKKKETNVFTLEKGEKLACNPLLHSTNILDEITSKNHYKKRYKTVTSKQTKKINHKRTTLY